MSVCTQRIKRDYKAGPCVTVYHSAVCSRYVHTGACSRQTVPYDRLEALVLDEIQAAVADPRALVFAPPAPSKGTERGRLEARLREMPSRIDRQMQAYEAGAISLDDLRAARERLRAEEDGIRELLAAVPVAPNLTAFSARAEEALAIIGSSADLAARRRALVGLISYISWSKTQQRLEIVWRQ